MFAVDAKVLAGIVGIIVSLLFTLIPGLKTWYDGLGKWKGLFMFGLMLLVAGAMFGLSCVPSFPYPVFTCDVAGFWAFLTLLASALVSNQLTYLLTNKFGE